MNTYKIKAELEDVLEQIELKRINLVRYKMDLEVVLSNIKTHLDETIDLKGQVIRVLKENFDWED